jgi:hypothetical protein
MSASSTPQAGPPQPPVAAVLAILSPKPGVAREQVMAVMPAEARHTAELYLNGKIRDWYSRCDGPGAVFLLETTDEAEARAIMSDLPLIREELVDHQLIPVGPLQPLRLLLTNA